MFLELMMNRVGGKFGDLKIKPEKRPLRIIKLIFSILIGTIQIAMILKMERARYNFSKPISHRALYQC